MFNSGDNIVYGTAGVCRVDGTKLMDCTGSGEEKQYYVLRPVGQDYVIYAPVDGGVFMRPVLTREEADRLIDTIPKMRVATFHSSVLRELTEHYQAAISTHDCGDLVELAMSLYSKKMLCEQHKGKFGAIDTRYMKRAEELLNGELSVALDIPKGEVQAYIEARIGKPQNGG